MENYKPLWVKGAIILAINFAKAGYKPVSVGLGERDFYVDIESDSSISLEEAKKVIKETDIAFELRGDSVEYNGMKIKIEVNESISSSTPKYFEILNISTHHPQPGVQYVRIRGVAFETDEQLKDYLSWLEKAQETDHRLIGERLDLFSFHEEAGSGLVLFHPKGQIIRNELINLMREINDSMNYQEVYTSHVYKSDLWKISGHYTLYRDKLILFNMEGEEYGVKPMNCPGHILIYKSRPRTYRDLPIRLSEFGHVYRWEKKGELYGLLRVRGLVQDDGHIFLREDQLKDEVKMLIKKVLEVWGKFGFKQDDIKAYVSTRPDESIGTDEQWEKATNALIDALKEVGMNYGIKEKEGAFYGPKIDFDVRDSLGRWWQLSTIQVDFNLPERFKIEYTDKDGSKKRPVMVHRAILGSIDRCMAILLEHFMGKLPTWLSPIQVRILPITDEVNDYAEKLFNELRKNKIRVEISYAGETLSKRIKTAYDEGVPYLLIVGKKEASEGKVTVRGRGNVEIRNIKFEDFVNALKAEINDRDVEQSAIKKLKG